MDYQVRERLGRGGMGVVDLGTGPDGRAVALKRIALHGSARDMERARRRVHREAEVLARLQHPGVVRLLDVVDDGDEVVLVMPYLAGGTLGDHVRARGPLSPGQVGLLADTLLDALAAAHRQGIVHRDIKPANVLFDETGRACLADFGVATLRDATDGLTATGAIVGTPDYMAPEQARGESASPASDVFSLGATLLFAATGEPPYGRIDPRLTLERAARGRLAPLPPTLDRTLRRRLAPTLRKDPARRPTAAAAAGGPAGTVVLPPSARRSRRPALAAVVGLAVLATFAVVATAALVLRDNRIGLSAGDEAEVAAAPSTSTPCTPKTYQPCGGPAAPNTNGSTCIEGHADYDGDVENGCEAEPDDVDGSVLDRDVRANLVPGDDVDRYPVPVTDKLHLTCDGTLEVTLTAPRGTSARLEVFDGTDLLGTAVSTDGERATVELLEPSCWEDDSTELTAAVSWEGDERSPERYRLTRKGSY